MSSPNCSCSVGELTNYCFRSCLFTNSTSSHYHNTDFWPIRSYRMIFCRNSAKFWFFLNCNSVGSTSSWSWARYFSTFRPEQNGCYFGDGIFKVFLEINIDSGNRFVLNRLRSNSWRDNDQEQGRHVVVPLTHLPLDKMAAVSADDIFEWIFLNENGRISIQISLKLVPKSPTDDEPALVQVMAWRQTGDKPLHEPMMTQFTDAYVRH